VRYINSVPLLEDLASGNVCVAVGWSGDIIRARVRSAEAGLDSDIRYVIPKEGTLSWVDALAIPADAPNPDEAHEFIDFMLRADSVGRRKGTTAGLAGAQPGGEPCREPHLDALSHRPVGIDAVVPAKSRQPLLRAARMNAPRPVTCT
jgi:spermidine/putrescine-binding protein